MRLKILIGILLISCVAFYANANMMIAGGGVAASGGCTAGTYSFLWDGNYPSDNGKACYNSGAANEDDSQSGGTLTGDTFAVTYGNQYITWPASSGANIGIDDEVGTIWLTATIVTYSEGCMLFESVNSAESIVFYIYGSAAKPIGRHVGNGHSESVLSANTISNGTPIRLAYSWDTSAGTGAHAVKVGTNDWEAQSENIDPWTGTPDDITIGENAANLGGGDDISIRDVYIIHSYQAADPAPL